MQCISAVKLITFILNVCILGGFHAQKTVCFLGCALVTGFFPRNPPLFSAFGLNFWTLGASSPFVTPISGYAYERVSNNKQYITPGEFKPYIPN